MHVQVSFVAEYLHQQLLFRTLGILLRFDGSTNRSRLVRSRLVEGGTARVEQLKVHVVTRRRR